MALSKMSLVARVVGRSLRSFSTSPSAAPSSLVRLSSSSSFEFTSSKSSWLPSSNSSKAPSIALMLLFSQRTNGTRFLSSSSASSSSSSSSSSDSNRDGTHQQQQQQQQYHHRRRRMAVAAVIMAAAVGGGGAALLHERRGPVDALLFGSMDNTPDDQLPVIEHPLVFAPHVPPPVRRNYRARVKLTMSTVVVPQIISGNHYYEYWTFDGHVPGPFIRARVGDILDVTLTNKDMSGMPHNIDFHSVVGPGGGAGVLTTESGGTTQAAFKLLYPGLFIYHCAVGPVGVHIAQGMYGLMLVEPKEPLPAVDKEFYVLQHEIYCEDPEQQVKPADDDAEETTAADSASAEKGEEEKKEKNIVPLEFSYEDAVKEIPRFIFFNGSEKALQEDGMLQVNQGDRVRIYFGNAGPNLISSFHIIGAVFDKVYKDGDLMTPPVRCMQTVMVSAGGAAAMEFDALIPGGYSMVDHSILRIEKGCVGFLNVNGTNSRRDLFNPIIEGVPCENCRHHP